MNFIEKCTEKFDLVPFVAKLAFGITLLVWKSNKNAGNK